MARRILFVCTGNICRSPTAEYAFKSICAQRGLAVTVESRGTSGYHTGEGADSRAIETAARHGIDMRRHIVQQVSRQDLLDFDLVFGMDMDHVSQLRSMAPTPASREKIKLFLHECAPGCGYANVPDPYYDDDGRFEMVFDLVMAGCLGLAERLAAQTI